MHDAVPVKTPVAFKIPPPPKAREAPQPRAQKAASKVAAPPAVARTEGDWREGRPKEDPEKMKRWGYISAKPSEFLIHMRNGSVVKRSSGQGATCFKRPRDSVAIVPTSLQRLKFTADQVTKEKVGVAIAGLAVFRIADPMLAFRVLNFSYPERAQEKLQETLGDMLIGATRRLVANHSVEECLQKRKSALASELLYEVAPVVGGQGRPDDVTVQGWGVVLDTIEIQEVRVQSDAIFAQMQAPFRTALEREATIARAALAKETRLRQAKDQLEVDAAELENARAIDQARAEEEKEKAARAKTLALLRVENKSAVDKRTLEERAVMEAQEREVERAAAEGHLLSEQRLVAERAGAVRQEDLLRQEHVERLEAKRAKAQLELEQRAAERQRQRELASAQREKEVELEALRKRAELAEREAELAAEIANRDAAQELARLAREREEHEAWLALEQTEREVLAAKDALAKARLVADIERDALLAEANHAEQLRAVDVLRRRATVAKDEAATKAQLLLAERLPDLANAVGQKFGEIKLTQIGGEGGLNLSPAVSAFGEVVTLAKSLLAQQSTRDDDA